MSPRDTAVHTLDRDAAGDIARAERRRATLERLTEVGMAAAEAIGARVVGAPSHPEPRHDAGRSFAAVARAVRMTVAFEARIDAEVIAMRKGEAAPARPPRNARPAAEAVEPAPAFGFAPEIPPSPERARVRGAVWGAINNEIGDLVEAQEALDCLHERLIEGEDYDALLALPWRGCVAAICADLGLSPDWSLWSDEAGFARPPTGPGYDWPRVWAYNPHRAEERRRRSAVVGAASFDKQAADGLSALRVESVRRRLE